jgi:anti-sigma B factor antagonist
MLTINRWDKDGKQVFVIDGRVDTDGAHQMEEQLTKSITDGNYHIVLDLSETNYLNSAGLRILADVLTQCRDKGGDVKLAAPNSKVMRVLEIIGFDKFFNVFLTVEDALVS